jgi:hypothetical protein
MLLRELRLIRIAGGLWDPHSGLQNESAILWWIWGNKGASGEGQNLLSGPSESSDIKDKGKIELLHFFVWYSG